MSGNPFDPFAAAAAAPAPPQPYGMPAAPVPATPSTPQRPQMNVNGGGPYGGQPQMSMMQPPQPPPQQMQPPQPQYNPYQPQPPAQPVQPSQQLVVSAQQSNPYAGLVTPQQPPQTPQGQPAYPQALVPSVGAPTQPWAVAPPTAATGAAAPVSGNPFDPFAPPPAAAPAPPPAAPPVAFQQQPAPPPAAPPVASDPFGLGSGPPAAPPPAQPQPTPQPQPAVVEPEPQEIVPAYQSQQQQAYNNYVVGGGGTGGGAVGQNDRLEPTQNNQLTAFEERNYNDRQLVPASERQDDRPNQIVVRSPDEVRNKYSNAISKQAPPGASPLPKAELVRKKGYVLSRISFRTIVMKKWKQSFWVQYGSHTMLWFRSESDFSDWLNNPYHNQAQRNFLIKLAVNFVHDLYKPNVRGYQVTQCRTKGYGTKTIRQFKLERWMDYGPTIAAAFGSYDQKEVDACREAIVECMKNTPLDNGIRATGAVKEHHEQMKQIEDETHQLEEQLKRSQQERQNELMEQGTAGQVTSNDVTGSYYQNSFPVGATANADGSGKGPPPTSSQSLVSSTDLLGDHATFDDSASVPPGALVPAAQPTSYPGAPPSTGAAAAAGAPYYQQPPQPYPTQQSQPPPPQPQAAYGQSPPAQQTGYYQQPQFSQPPPQQPPQADMGYGYAQQPSQPPPPAAAAGYPTAAYPQPSGY